MLKLTLAVLAVALAGTASAAGWRSMRIDASSEDNFVASVSALREKLPHARRHVFDLALQDIWAQGANAATNDQREYPTGEYLRQLDGLKYKEVVTFTDPTGETADTRLRQINAQLHEPRQRNQRTPTSAAWPQEPYRPGSLDGANMRGGIAQQERNDAWHAR